MVAVLQGLLDDGLETPDVGDWGERKYRLIALYAEMFAKVTRTKWETRVYVDLFAGAGRAKLRESGLIVDASPLLVLSIQPTLERYIFCDLDRHRLGALEERVRRDHVSANATFIAGDVNERIDSVLAAIPRASQSNRVLSFCVVDPYRLSDLSFDTIRSLARGFVDFLVLVPSYMHAQRFWKACLDPRNKSVERFLDMPDWRKEWDAPDQRRKGLGPFVVAQFNRRMVELEYTVGMSTVIHAIDNKRPLYHLLGYSRHPLGTKLWKAALESSTEQRSLQFDG